MQRVKREMVGEFDRGGVTARTLARTLHLWFGPTARRLQAGGDLQPPLALCADMHSVAARYSSEAGCTVASERSLVQGKQAAAVRGIDRLNMGIFQEIVSDAVTALPQVCTA